MHPSEGDLNGARTRNLYRDRVVLCQLSYEAWSGTPSPQMEYYRECMPEPVVHDAQDRTWHQGGQ